MTRIAHGVRYQTNFFLKTFLRMAIYDIAHVGEDIAVLTSVSRVFF